MKRGKPLTRKTPLKASKGLSRGDAPLKRSQPVTRQRKPISQRSAKARQVAAVRVDIRLELLALRGPYCEGCPVTPVGDPEGRAWTDMHEVLTRARGGDPTDPGNILCLCRRCHEWVTTHETQARALGLVRGRTAEEHRAATGVNLTGGMMES